MAGPALPGPWQRWWGPRHARIHQRGGTGASKSVAEMVGTATRQEPPTRRDELARYAGTTGRDTWHQKVS